MRRKEIFDKFQYCNYDISDLINSSLEWIKSANEKNKGLNVLNLINQGKQINDKFNLIQEINEIFKLLEEYEKSGITIIKNEYNEMPLIFQENENIIKSLNLTSYIEVSKESKIKSNENSEINNNSSTNVESSKIYCKKKINDNLRYNNTVSEFFKNKNNKVLKLVTQDKNNITKNNSVNYNKISVAKIKSDINTDLNESYFPFLYSPSSNYILSSGNNSGKNVLEFRKNHESIQINNTDNNINFNGHIFNYNSDSNTSSIIPEKNKNNENKDKKGKYNEKNCNKNKIKDIKKNDIKTKFQKFKIKKCFSFSEKIKLNHSNKNIKININKRPRLTVNNLFNTNNKIIPPFHKEIKFDNYQEKSFTNYIKNKNNKKNNYNYKTLNNNELEKYVNYQLKKLKQNFSRINLRDFGIKLICSHYLKNKNNNYKEIKLQGCHLNDKDLQLLINCFIENNITIPIMNISDNELTDKSIKQIIKLINANEKITNLIMKNNSFSKQSKEILKKLIKNRKEELLELNIQI